MSNVKKQLKRDDSADSNYREFEESKSYDLIDTSDSAHDKKRLQKLSEKEAPLKINPAKGITFHKPSKLTKQERLTLAQKYGEKARGI